MHVVNSKRFLVTVLVFVWFGITGISYGQATYVPLGPHATASYEEALHEQLACYACGIWPRQEKLRDALKANDIGESIIVSIGKSLARVIKKDIQPTNDEWNSSEWLGLPEFRWLRSDFIIGRFASKSLAVKNIEFQASDGDLYLTFYSDGLFSKDVSTLDDTQVIEALTSVLNLPKESNGKLKVERHFANLGNEKIPVCYGKIRGEWNEHSLDCSTREWWSYMPFWITKGKLFVSISTVDWKNGEKPKYSYSRFDFKGLKRKVDSPQFPSVPLNLTKSIEPVPTQIQKPDYGEILFPPKEKALIGPSGEMYANKKAYDLAEEARKYDMSYGSTENQDREKAVALYQQAMKAQPGAKSNAFIANRIGQLYDFYYNPEIGLKPDPDKAHEWWKRCAELSDPTQLLWAQAQMGMLCTKIGKKDGESALKICQEVLAVNTDNIEIDNWKYYPPEDLANTKTAKEYFRSRVIALQAQVAIKKKALEKLKERAKAKETLARQNAFLGGLWSFRFWLVITGATLVLAVLARQGHAWQKNRKVKA